jgi:rhodanese-related sulfurtransferase
MTAADMVQRAAVEVMSITPESAVGCWRAGAACFLDVREPEEVTEHGWIDGSVHVPRGLLEFRADPASPSYRPDLDPATVTIVYDTAGHRAVLAARALLDLGYEQVAFLEGGFGAWKRAGLPVAGTHGSTNP